ncbi:MAG: GNAT family N-acetyltransferase [Candidatus Nanopelagicales bacterium]
MTRVPGPGPGVREVVVTDLEMTSPDQLRPGRVPDVEVSLVRAVRPAPEYSRFLYRAVGGDWYWLDRIGWTYEQWTAWVEHPGHELWVAYVEGSPAGYVELLREGDAVEVAYFGLLPAYAGLGLGGWLLTEATRRAWALEGVTRVWLHTCELDSEPALANYRARGFTETGTSVEYWDTTSPSPGPWRGAR